jgi:hypothetical protein
MKIEDQVCSLELAQKLKELGVKQSSLFSFIYYKGMTFTGYELKQTAWKLEDQEYVSAFTVAELGEMLPENIITFKFKEMYECCFLNSPHRTNFTFKTEANARAKMLIYLLENGFITND